jgi:hypothetical protein
MTMPPLAIIPLALVPTSLICHAPVFAHVRAATLAGNGEEARLAQA